MEIYELFIVPLSPAMEMKNIHEAIIADLKDMVKESVDEAWFNTPRTETHFFSLHVI